MRFDRTPSQAAARLPPGGVGEERLQGPAGPRKHRYTLDRCPLHHRAPFNHLLIAQAPQEGVTLGRHDSPCSAYAVPVRWERGVMPA